MRTHSLPSTRTAAASPGGETIDDDLTHERDLAASMDLADNVAYARGLMGDVTKFLENGTAISRQRAALILKLADVHLAEVIKRVGSPAGEWEDRIRAIEASLREG